ncbi:DUF222 domain-containing protein [Cellulomonas sp. ICMP 17802]|uniref:DUF222 domain-containing protein n=1 Tax=Cellulomonas sp. ICMP 17802 TaxID=3239199 RepID=UPI00351B5DC4
MPGAAVVDLGAVEGFPLPVDLADLVAMLASVPVAEVSGAALVHGVAAWQQVIAMAQAAQAGWVRELVARTPMDPLGRVADEVACALVCTRRLAQDLVLRADATATHLVLADAWAAGGIEARKIDVILTEAQAGTTLGSAVRDAVIHDAVQRAGDLTAPQLARHVRAMVLAADPDAGDKQRVAARDRRGVFLDPAPDAMARLIAYLPAAEATAAFTAIDALAGNAGVDGDTRTVDQRRADAFADVFTGLLDRQATPDGTALPRRHGQRAALQVTVAASTLAGLDNQPGYLGSYGPIPAQLARELAQDATWRRILTDPTGQACAVDSRTYRPGADLTRTIIARDVTCTFPGCRQPATRCEIDHRTPYDHHRSSAGTDQAAPAGNRSTDSQAPGQDDAHEPQTCAANLHALCKHHHQAKTKRWWQVTYNPTTGVSTWTDRHGLTYARHPTPVLIPDHALHHRPPPPHPGHPPF